MSSIYWKYFPNTEKIPDHLNDIIEVFKKNLQQIESLNEKHSNNVLEVLVPSLKKLEYEVESSKRNKIPLPVLYGDNGKILKKFEVDAYHRENKTIIEVEAGRAVLNNQFISDIFKAILIQDVAYLVIAVLKKYETRNGISNDYNEVKTFFEAIYSSQKFKLPLDGVLIIGY